MPHVRPIIRKHIDEMLENGIIEHSTSPWAAAVVLVPKKNNELRICLDYRLLNKVTKPNAYGLPRIGDALASLSGNNFFTALDCCAGYWQIPLRTEEDRQKAAFRTFCGHYQPTRLPFGLVNGPAHFQSFMDLALAGLNYKCTLAYVDDVLIFSPTYEQHLVDLDSVFDALRKVNIHLKASKCTMASPEVTYLGHIVGSHGVKPCPNKIAAVKDFAPTTKKELHSFIGLAGYYRKFIPQFAKISRPITRLIAEKAPLKELPDDVLRAVSTLKEKLCSSPVLAHPDFTKPFEIHTDASPFAIGAVLSQRHAGQDHPVMYISRTLKSSEVNYHQYELEVLSLIWAIGVFRPYLVGRPFRAVTDCKALLQVLTRKQGSRVIRWTLNLQEFDTTSLGMRSLSD